MLEAASKPSQFVKLPDIIAEQLENIGPLSQAVAEETFESQINADLGLQEKAIQASAKALAEYAQIAPGTPLKQLICELELIGNTYNRFARNGYWQA
jgi:hypothetical protein